MDRRVMLEDRELCSGHLNVNACGQIGYSSALFYNKLKDLQDYYRPRGLTAQSCPALKIATSKDEFDLQFDYLCLIRLFWKKYEKYSTNQLSQTQVELALYSKNCGSIVHRILRFFKNQYLEFKLTDSIS